MPYTAKKPKPKSTKPKYKGSAASKNLRMRNHALTQSDAFLMKSAAKAARAWSRQKRAGIL